MSLEEFAASLVSTAVDAWFVNVQLELGSDDDVNSYRWNWLCLTVPTPPSNTVVEASVDQ